MLEIKGNIWDFLSKENDTYICIPTNKTLNNSGELVMGAGLALAAKLKFPGIEMSWGKVLQEVPNVHVHLSAKENLICFPTKNHWKEKSSIEILKQSIDELLSFIEFFGLQRVFLPRIGCGLGGLSWEKEVKPFLETYDFKDKLVFVHNGD